MRNFFYLQKSDRRIILCLIVIIVGALVAITMLDSRQEEEPTALKPDKKQIEKRRHTTRRQYARYEKHKPELFPFDPNTADSVELLRLGLRGWQIRNLIRYRNAGGVFRKPEDLSKLYGMTAEQYQQLKPFVKIDKAAIPDERQFYAYMPIEERDTLLYPIKLQPEERIVLNRADTTVLRKVPGVGQHFARKIVEYRERLGGYYRVQQLLEIEDFPESAVTFFIIPDDDVKLRKMNINQLTLNELKRHPYINFYQARDIVDYRRLHGRIHSLNDLSLSRDFTPEAIERLEHYVEY
jgi:DNA uptake protein ComE-like DNA-binding protein